MSRPVSFVVAFAFCCAAILFESRLAMAQDDAPRSTIRLCTATEPVRESAPVQAAPQDRAPVAEQDAPPQPVSLAAEAQPVERAESANGANVASTPAPSAP